MASRGDRKQRKEARDKRQLRKNLEQQQRNRASLNRALAALGLTDIFSRLSKSVRDQAIGWRNPKPQVVIESESPSHPDLLEAKAQLEQLFSVWTVSLKNGSSLTLAEFYTVAVGLYESDVTVTRPIDKTILDQIHTVIHETLEDSDNILAYQIEMYLERYSRMDDKFIGATLTTPKNQSGRHYLQIALHLYPKAERRVVVDGTPRRAYRCGAATDHAMRWVSWKSDAAGLGGPVREIPVYLQEHALQRLRERVTIELDNGWVEAFVWQSLSLPVFTRRTDSLLVEYRFVQYKLGYFVVEFVGDLAIITTFLFLTMNGTPEGDNLYELLRVTRGDKTYLGLDELNTFLLSDVRKDLELRAAFEQCGCGHLFRMIREDYNSEDGQGKAEEVKKYLRTRLNRVLKWRR